MHENSMLCRFDFSHNGVIEAQRLEKIEAMCRQSAQQQQQVYAKEVSLAEAQHISGEPLQNLAYC